MAKLLLLGTWLAQPAQARDQLSRANEGLSFSGLSGQVEVTGPRITIRRDLIVNDRSWTYGMPRSVIDGQVEQHTDDVFVVVDEPKRDGRG